MKHYDAGVPETLAPYPDRTLLDYLSDAARDRPKQAVLLFKGTRITYSDLERLSDECAAAFAALGVKGGDRVGLLLPNCPQFFIAQFGAWKLGAIVAPLNPIYTEHELEGPLRDHGVETIVTLTRFYNRVKRVQPRTPVRRVIATNIKAHFPPVLRVLFTLLREKREGDNTAVKPGDHQLEHLLLVNRGRKPSRAAIGTGDPAVLLMSGGTTGTPKGVLGTHGGYVMAGLQAKAWHGPKLTADGAGDVIFMPLPMFHVYANVGSQGMALVHRCAMALVPNPRDLADLVATINTVTPTVFTGVPTLFTALLNHPLVQAGKIDFTSITVCLSGASALLAETKQRFEAMTGARIVEGYSLTEAMMAACCNPNVGLSKLGSVGIPLPDVRVRIVDADDSTRELAANQVGEIVLIGPQIMTGYWNRPDETAIAVRDGWLYTGDLGYLDDDGYLFIVDRKKDMIKTSGFQVWPREVEEVLAKHPAVAEVGVAGVVDPSKGEAVKAWVVLRAGHTASEQELRDFCRSDLTPYKVPSQIAFRGELPKTMVGKILRRALRDEEKVKS